MDFVPSKNEIFPPAYVAKIKNGTEMMKKSEKMVNSKVTNMLWNTLYPSRKFLCLAKYMVLTSSLVMLSNFKK